MRAWLRATKYIALTVTALYVLLAVMPDAYAVQGWLRHGRPFDGSAQAVLGKFNQLSARWADEGRIVWSDALKLALERRGGEGEFAFVSGGMGDPNGLLRLNITGEEEQGKVRRMWIEIEPVKAPDVRYLAAADELAQLIVLSLCGEITEKKERAVLRTLLYDVRPFSYGTGVEAAEHRIMTIVGQERLNIGCVMDDAGRFSIDLALLGQATWREVMTDNRNNHCNRLIAQANDACATIHHCLIEMRQLLDAEGAPDWDGMNAVGIQIEGTLLQMSGLIQELMVQRKTLGFAVRVQECRVRLIALGAESRAAFRDRDMDGLRRALDESIEEALTAQELMQLIRSE